MAILQTLQRTNWNKQKRRSSRPLPADCIAKMKARIQDGGKSGRAAPAEPSRKFGI